MSDPKCPQYKKLEQRRIFAAQVLDDRLEVEQPDQLGNLEDQEQTCEPDTDVNSDEGQPGQPGQETSPEGSQHESEESSYEEYDGYASPSEEEEEIPSIRIMHKDNETVYIHMMHEDDSVNNSPPQEEISASILDSPLDNAGWQPHYEALKQ
jgi:hypothetical protein